MEQTSHLERAKYGDDEEEDEEADEDEVEKIHWQSSETFKTITVWDHHILPDPKQDQWIRAIEEWIVMADAVSSYLIPRSRKINATGYDADLDGK